MLVDGAGEARLCVWRSTVSCSSRRASRRSTRSPSRCSSGRRLDIRSGRRGTTRAASSTCRSARPRQRVSAGRRQSPARADRGAASTPFSPILVDALDALAASVSLALESAALTEQAHRRENEARFASLVRNASDLITVVDRDGIVVYQSPSIERILGYHADDVQGRSFEDLLITADRERLRQVLGMQRRGGAGSYTFDCTLRHATAGRSNSRSSRPTCCDDEHVRGIVLNGRDVSERKAFEEQLAHQAFHDPLTGPAEPRAVPRPRRARARPRRARARDASRCSSSTSTTSRRSTTASATPPATSCCARSPRGCVDGVRATDTAARLGGDEFAVLLEDVDGPAGGARRRRAHRRRVRAAVRRSLRTRRSVVRPSIGIALAARRRGNPGDARRADAQRRRRDVHREARGQGRLPGLRGGDARDACSSGSSCAPSCSARSTTSQFELHYQPIVDLDDRRDRRGRGARALAAPDARPRAARAVHPARRGDGPDRRARPLGAARGVPRRLRELQARPAAGPTCGSASTSRSSSCSTPTSSPTSRAALEELGARPAARSCSRSPRAC